MALKKIPITNNPDDPYEVTVELDRPNNQYLVTVSAMTLGDSDEVKAECQRRADSIGAYLKGLLNGVG